MPSTTKTVTIDLSRIVPLAATPHSPGNIATVASLTGMPVDQVCIGSCTNSSYKDLATVARIMKNKTVAPDVSLIVAPGSRQALQNIDKAGHLGDLIAAGARIDESACGFCIGNSQSPASNAVSLRTSNRNFEGRSGTKDARVYLVSCETAAAAAIKGEIVDPRKLGHEYPAVKIPEKFIIDDRMFIFPKSPKEAAKGRRLFRGPNIGAPPANSPFPAGYQRHRDDQGRRQDHYRPYHSRRRADEIPVERRRNIPNSCSRLWMPVSPCERRRLRDAGRHNIIVGGASYGEGSSREHAAICPMFLGVKIVLAKSFQRIHTDNLINFGILPLTFKNETDYDTIDQGDELDY